MKKIIIIAIVFIIAISCSKSKNDEITTNTTPADLIGNWKFVGYYDDYSNPNGSNFHPVSDGFNISFIADGTCHSNANQYYNNGTYTVSNNSILTTNYTSTIDNSTATASEKIGKLTSTELILESINDQISSAYKYVKVNGASGKN